MRSDATRNEGLELVSKAFIMETAQTVASWFEQSSLSKDFDPNTFKRTCDEVLGKYQEVEEELAKKHNLELWE